MEKIHIKKVGDSQTARKLKALIMQMNQSNWKAFDTDLRLCALEAALSSMNDIFEILGLYDMQIIASGKKPRK